MYNVMDEETTTRLWSKLETLYMTKILSNKLYLKKKLYGLRMKEGTMVLKYLNFFNKVISELLAIDVKIDEENKMLILLSSLVQSHDHIVIPCSTVKKLSSWRRSRQLSYLMRSEKKSQIKRSIKDHVWWSREEKKEKKKRKVWTHRRRVTFVTGKVIERMTASARVIEEEKVHCGCKHSN